MADLLQFFAVYLNNLTLWARLLLIFFVSCSNVLCMLLIITSFRTSQIMAEFFFQWMIYLNLSHFTSIINLVDAITSSSNGGGLL